MIAKRLLIFGRVQGVGYRAWLSARAEALGVSGWVCNRVDGTVEALVAGAPAALEVLLKECHQGPRFAEVVSVVDESAGPPQLPGFHRVKPT